MPSRLEDWDLERYRRLLRERAARLKRDPRVRVRFDESDLTQETLQNAVEAKQIPEGMSEEQKLNWLAAIQNHTLIDLYRQQFAAKRDVRREQDLQSLQEALQASSIDQAQLAVDPSAEPGEKAEQRERERRTNEAIERLASPQREILRARQRGLTFEAIATEMALAASVVAGQYYRGLQKLKDELGSG